MVHLFFVVLTWCQFTFAADAANTSLASSEQVIQAAKPKFQYTAVLDYKSNLYERDSDKFADTSTLTLVPKWNLKNEDSVSLLTEISKDFQDEERFELSTTNLIYGRKAIPFTFIDLASSARLILPVSEELKDRQGLKVGLAMDVTPKLKAEAVGLIGLTLSARTRVTKNFHDFETATSGNSNIEYALSERVDLGYDLTEKWNVSTILIYGLSRTYKNNQKESFTWAQEISYAVNAMTTIGVGHSNEGGLLKPNGDSNVSLFDEDSSTVYAYLQLVN
ncbi:MAG: hypothetical protein KDD37_07445 [Bdellovibrionales bacterium]|nr:hypothetical protein [Bdellovibrionales bacterium]